MAEGSKNGTFAFDQFRLDVGNLMLYRDGSEILIAPKIAKTLAVLVESAGTIITKEELIERVWDDSIVEESNLTQYLYILRKTLGNMPDGRPYIETLRRRGYRFNGEVERMSEPVTTPKIAVARPAESSPSFGAIEREGNVLRVVDWQTADTPHEDEVREAVEAAPVATLPKSRRSLKSGLVIAAVILLAGTIGVGFWLMKPRAAEVTDNEAVVQAALIPLTNGENVNDATISRDGKYFTYHENDGDFSRMLVQQTGQAKPVEILPRGKRSLGAKAFSPDSQSIFFIARDATADHASIFRVPTLGGVPVKVVEFANSVPSFSPDGGSMIFHRLDSRGNSSILISGIDGTKERALLSEGAERNITPYPAWSPDGNMIAFSVVEKSNLFDGGCKIMALDLKTSETRSLSNERWDTCYRMEWRRDGTGIVLVGTKAGDGNSIRRDQVYFLNIADGATRRLTTDVHRNQTDSLGVTDSNQVLHVPFSRSSQIWVMDPSGNSKTATALTTGSSDGRTGLVVLPDGRIAFTARTGENLGAWIMEPDGSDRRQFISDPLIIEELRASPDGKYFFYATTKESRSHLYRVDADGSNPKAITTGETHETDSAVSPDGKWIVFDSLPVSNWDQRRLWKASIEGGAPTKISDVYCAVPNFSRSGKFLSCVWDNKIYIVSPDDGALLNTFTAVNVAYLNIGARFTPDEKALVYLAQQRGATNIWIQPLDGKPAKPLTDFPNGDVYNFAYSPDGSKLYLARGFQMRDAVLLSGF